MTKKQAITLVKNYGIVLESAKGPVPNLAEAIVGEPIRGTWWGHPKSQQIFALTRAVREFDEILVSRLIIGKITHIHKRLWPALVRLFDWFESAHIARIREIHTSSGHHKIENTPYPEWVPTEVVTLAKTLSEEDAAAEFGGWLSKHPK